MYTDVKEYGIFKIYRANEYEWVWTEFAGDVLQNMQWQIAFKKLFAARIRHERLL